MEYVYGVTKGRDRKVSRRDEWKEVWEVSCDRGREGGHYKLNHY